jgi:V8-like Glu-specific endopeptidase
MNKNIINVIAKIRYGGEQKNMYKNRKIDMRVKVDDNLKFPYCCIGTLLTYYDGNYWLGTGTLIGPNLVLTAAHNLYVKNEFKGLSSKFYIGLNGDEFSDYAECSFSENSCRSFIPDNYKSGKDPYDDFAILVLDKPLGDIYGYFDLGSSKFDQLLSNDKLQFYCYGFPGDKTDKIILNNENEKLIMKEPHYEMWGMKVDPHLNKNLIEYTFDSYSGQSGSCIFYEQNGKGYLIGIHIMHNPSSRIGYAVYINSERYNQIINWITKIKYT